jgi:preprotein translocase subunit SecE
MAKEKSEEKSAVKKAAETAKKSANKKNQKNESAADFFQGVKHELSKVVWPTKKELASYTAVVIVTCTVYAVGFWLMDLGILEVLKQLLGITLS